MRNTRHIRLLPLIGRRPAIGCLWPSWRHVQPREHSCSSKTSCRIHQQHLLSSSLQPKPVSFTTGLCQELRLRIESFKLCTPLASLSQEEYCSGVSCIIFCLHISCEGSSDPAAFSWLLHSSLRYTFYEIALNEEVKTRGVGFLGKTNYHSQPLRLTMKASDGMTNFANHLGRASDGCGP